MESLQGLLARLLMRIALVVTVLTACCALTTIGMVWLAAAVNSALTPITGSGLAGVITGALCILPLVLLLTLLWYRSRHVLPAQAAGSVGLRAIVRENPWEAVATAFLLGVTQPRNGLQDIASARDALRMVQEALGERNGPAASGSPVAGDQNGSSNTSTASNPSPKS